MQLVRATSIAKYTCVLGYGSKRLHAYGDTQTMNTQNDINKLLVIPYWIWSNSSILGLDLLGVVGVDELEAVGKCILFDDNDKLCVFPPDVTPFTDSIDNEVMNTSFIFSKLSILNISV